MTRYLVFTSISPLFLMRLVEISEFFEGKKEECDLEECVQTLCPAILQLCSLYLDS
jgi:hypothetical protein